MHVVYEHPVPYRFKDGVGKAEYGNILDSLFGEIVIDTENLAFVEVFVNLSI